MSEKENFEIDVNHIETMYSEQLEGVELHITERDIGNGPQFAIETYDEDTGSLFFESQWYNKDEFEAFTSGMKHLSRIFAKAETERNDE